MLHDDRQLYCHRFFFPLLEGGNAVRFFHFVFFFVWFGVFFRFLPFFSSQGRFLKKIFGSELLFLGGLVGLVFFGGVLPMFLLHFLAVRFRKCLKKILLMSGLVFFLGSFSLPFVFSVDVVFRVCLFFFCFKRHSSGSNRTPPHALAFLCLVLFVLSRRVCLFRPFWPCVPLLGVSSGCHSGPRAFLGFSWYLL